VGHGYESGDPFAAFLPPALRIEGEVSEDHLRAVVFVVSTSTTGTARSGQEYELPPLVLAGTEYLEMPFQDLHDRLCTALRGTRPRLVLEVFQPGGTAALVFEDGAITPVAVESVGKTCELTSRCRTSTFKRWTPYHSNRSDWHNWKSSPAVEGRARLMLDDALADYLAWERQDYQEALDAVRQGHEDVKAGRTVPADQFLDEFARRDGLPR
jgi:hypothetical protein